MKSIKIILNPIAGRGYGARSEPVLRRHLTDAGMDFDLVLTEGPKHASELASQAFEAGFDIIVAAGGDGTTSEVVNGLMHASGADTNGRIAGTLGVLPVGSGSDFANNVGVPADLYDACQRIVQGQERLVDVCRVVVDEQPPQFFDNTVNIGFGGIVTLEAGKVKWVRGMALYLPVVLKTVFLSQPSRMKISYDGEEVSMSAPMVCVANGAREGGGFFCTPDAQPDDGLFDMCIVHDIGRLEMLGLVPRFIDGSHVSRDSVTMARAKRVEISSPDNLIAHADGEMLCTEAHRLTFDILPKKLRVWC